MTVIANGFQPSFVGVLPGANMEGEVNPVNLKLKLMDSVNAFLGLLTDIGL